MGLQQENEKNTVIKKHINAIHCSNDLTLVQRKLFNALLFHAYHDLPTKSKYEISIKELCRVIGYDSRDYKKIRKALLDLITTAIEWNVINQNDEVTDDKWRASSIIAAAKIENGICTYEFSSIMRELLFQPEIYGKIDMKVMVEFGSGYGLALYENCIRYQDIPQTPWFPIDVFRKLIGVSKTAYANFCDFKKRVLDVAIKEVNKFTPINVTAELQRDNKKVTKIRFKLKNEMKASKEALPAVNVDLLQILMRDFNLSQEKSHDLIVEYEASYIEAKVELIKKSKPFIQGKIKNISAYLIDALAKDYQNSHSSMEILQAKRLAEEKKLKQQKQNEERLAEERALKKNEMVQSYLKNLNEKQYKELIKKFEEYLNHPERTYMRGRYNKLGFTSKPVQSMFNIFVYDICCESEISVCS